MVLVGLPGSGKSTFRQRFFDRQTFPPDDLVVISTDDPIEARAKEQGIGYNVAFRKHMPYAEEVMRASIKDAQERHTNVIWDQTMLTLKARRRFLSNFPADRWTRVAMVFEQDETVRRFLDSRRANTRRIPQKVIEEMKARYIRPTKEEGFDLVSFRPDGFFEVVAG
jgi:predicted kinase